MPTPLMNGDDSISHRTGGLRQPASIAPLIVAATSATDVCAAGRSESDVSHREHRHQQGDAEDPRPDDVGNRQIGRLGKISTGNGADEHGSSPRRPAPWQRPIRADP